MVSIATLKAALPRSYRQAGRRAVLRLAAPTTAGSGVVCPCCGKSARRFARFHGGNDQCARCGALMRHRALELYLRDGLRVEETGGDVLHVAPMAGVKHRLRSIEGVRYLSVDLDSPLADLRADVTDLPLADESFDLVICLHVLEHVPDDRAAIHEFFRVLRPGGKALIQVPPSGLEETFEDPTVTGPEERERVFGQYDHVRICGADYGIRLEAAGFDVTTVDYVKQLDEATRTTYGLRTGEPFYICAKPSPVVTGAGGTTVLDLPRRAD